MPRILVTTEPHGGGDTAVLLEERVSPAVLESDHYAAQLIERVGWAVVDAHDAEHERGRAGADTAPSGPERLS